MCDENNNIDLRYFEMKQFNNISFATTKFFISLIAIKIIFLENRVFF